MAGNVPTEDLEQITFISWFERTYPNVLIFHIPNGGKRSITQAMKFQKMGVKPGIPDLFIPEWRLWIEMKRTKGGSLSKDQKEKLEYLTEVCKYDYILSKGWEEGRKKIIEFLQNNPCYAVQSSA